MAKDILAAPTLDAEALKAAKTAMVEASGLSPMWGDNVARAGARAAVTAYLVAMAPAERVEVVPERYLHEMHLEGQNVHQQVTLEEEHPFGIGGLNFSANAEIVTTPLYRAAPTRACALDAAGMIEKTRDRLVEAVEAWGDGLDAGRVYNARQSVVMKALNAYLDAKAALAAGDSSSARLNAYDNERPRNAKRALTADDK